MAMRQRVIGTGWISSDISEEEERTIYRTNARKEKELMNKPFWKRLPTFFYLCLAAACLVGMGASGSYFSRDVPACSPNAVTGTSIGFVLAFIVFAIYFMFLAIVRAEDKS